jgi:hypothetical protein
MGIAKEVKAIFGLKIKEKKYKIFEPISSNLDIKIEDEKCLRYMGRIVRNIKVEESPKWLKERLNAVGQKSINNTIELDNEFEIEEFEDSEEEPIDIDSDDEYTDDGVFIDNISWNGDPYADDRLVELSDLEIENLINTRYKAKYIIRRLLYCKYFFTTYDFNGIIYHSLIERNQYLNDISFGEGNFYEIVIKKDNGVYDLDCQEENNFNYHETNYFGYFEEDFYVTNNNVRSYFFVFNTFDPRNIDEDFYSQAGNLKYERLSINFKNIRRIYHIWPGYSC